MYRTASGDSDGVGKTGRTPGATRSAKRLGFSNHGRTVSYEELHHLGLSKAVDEYHKLLKSKSSGSRNCGPEGCHICVFKALCLRPMPSMLQPDCLVLFVGKLWCMFSKIVVSFAAIIVPLIVALLLSPATVDDLLCPEHGYAVHASTMTRVLWALELTVILSVASRTRCQREKIKGMEEKGKVTPMYLSLLYGPSLQMSDRSTNVDAILEKSSGEIDAKEQEEFLRKVIDLVSKYGFRDAQADSITSFPVAVRWINMVAREIEHHQYASSAMSFHQAREAVEVLSRAIGQ